jgi:hypothetical protein
MLHLQTYTSINNSESESLNREWAKQEISSISEIGLVLWRYSATVRSQSSILVEVTQVKTRHEMACIGMGWFN